MKTITLINKGIGKDGRWEVREELDKFVDENFKILYEGAVRLGAAIEADYYAPRRIQINNTRLHAQQNLKYAGGHKYSSDYPPSEEQLIATAKDLQELLDAAGENITVSFQINIRKDVQEQHN